MTTQIKRCPECGDINHLYDRADVRWDPAEGDWVIGDTEGTIECTTCDWSGESSAIDAELPFDFPLPAALDRNMEEARRRWESFAVKAPATSNELDTAWLGLGCPGEYRQAVATGIMEPISKITPRVMGWYRLTVLGCALYRMCFPGSEERTSVKYRNGSEIVRDPDTNEE